MDGVLVRGLGASGAVVLACAALGGCVRMTDGAARPDADARPAVLAQALIDPSRFPQAYPAAALDPQATGEAISGVDGVAAGATVEPAGCAPPRAGTGPKDAVAAQGVDPGTRSALTVILIRSTTDLSARREQLGRCASLTATAGEVVTTVETVLRPPPPVDADDSLARETTIRQSSEPAVRVLALAAQVDDVWLTAAWSNNDPAVEPDTAALDALFSDALSALRRAER